ncbi:hypothetical protein Avbf_14945 [Armadillidium vulgare]|nr:hypothetical protein Avbf_14945 [Armadillidium vulgare]
MDCAPNSLKVELKLTICALRKILGYYRCSRIVIIKLFSQCKIIKKILSILQSATTTTDIIDVKTTVISFTEV